MMSHAEVNERTNRLFAEGLRGQVLERKVETMRQWQRLGLDAAAVDHLLPAVPLLARRRCRG